MSFTLEPFSDSLERWWKVALVLPAVPSAQFISDIIRIQKQN